MDARGAPDMLCGPWPPAALCRGPPLPPATDARPAFEALSGEREEDIHSLHLEGGLFLAKGDLHHALIDTFQNYCLSADAHGASILPILLQANVRYAYAPVVAWAAWRGLITPQGSKQAGCICTQGIHHIYKPNKWVCRHREESKT